MAKRKLEQIREAILDHRYALSEHAYDEMADDDLDVFDIESAILTGQLEETQTNDPRGPRYLVIGKATDQFTRVAVVVRFVEDGQLLIITVYELHD